MLGHVVPICGLVHYVMLCVSGAENQLAKFVFVCSDGGLVSLQTNGLVPVIFNDIFSVKCTSITYKNYLFNPL